MSEQIQEETKVEQPQELFKRPLQCSIDVGLVKMAFCIMDNEFKLLDAQTVNIKPEKEDSKQKRSMVEYECGIISNLDQMLNDIISRFQPDNFIVELQIGQYSAKNIEFCLLYGIKQKSKASITLLNPRCKLSLKFCEFIPKKDTKKYNQNKNQSVANCKAWLEQTNQSVEKLDRDQSDAILQCIYFIKNRSVIPIQEADTQEE